MDSGLFRNSHHIALWIKILFPFDIINFSKTLTSSLETDFKKHLRSGSKIEVLTYVFQGRDDIQKNLTNSAKVSPNCQDTKRKTTTKIKISLKFKYCTNNKIDKKCPPPYIPLL